MCSLDARGPVRVSIRPFGHVGASPRHGWMESECRLAESSEQEASLQELDLQRRAGRSHCPRLVRFGLCLVNMWFCQRPGPARIVSVSGGARRRSVPAVGSGRDGRNGWCARTFSWDGALPRGGVHVGDRETMTKARPAVSIGSSEAIFTVARACWRSSQTGRGK